MRKGRADAVFHSPPSKVDLFLSVSCFSVERTGQRTNKILSTVKTTKDWEEIGKWKFYR